MKKRFLIFTLIFSLFFINKNVFALENMDYLHFNVPDSEKLVSKENVFVSNFFNVDNRLDLIYKYNYYIRNYDSQGNYLHFSNVGHFPLDNVSYECNYSACVLTDYFVNFLYYPRISLDKDYEFSFIINKSDSVKFHNDFDFDFSNITFNFRSYEGDVTIRGSSDFIKYAYFKMHLGTANTDDYKNTAILVVGFRFSSDLYTKNDIGELKTLYFKTEGPENNLLVFPQNETARFKTGMMSLLENGTMSVSGSGTGSSGGGHTSGGGRHDNLDQVDGSDLSKFKSLDVCDSTDVVCHLKNILTMIKNSFIRLGNAVTNIVGGIIDGFKSLFVPSSSSIKDNFSKNYDLLHSHLGFLIYPFELISKFSDKLVNLKTTTSFSGSGWEFMGVKVLPAFKFDFNDVLRTDNIKTMYNVYLVIISGIIVFGFVSMCLKKFYSMFGSGN